jgi:1,2-phenylacetyl-CoA epoxidase catalytic subunit
MTQEVLCQYQKGEEKGVGLLRALKTFAPSEDVAREIDLQITDELKHDYLFAGRLRDLDIDCEGLKGSLNSVYDLAQECVDKKDWVSAITIQTVIEELAMATFNHHLPELDEDSQRILRLVIQDEGRHLEFGLRELQKVAAGNEEKIRAIHMRVAEIFKSSFKDNDYSADEHKVLQETVMRAYKLHKKRLSGIGVKLPGLFDVAAL